MRSGQPLSVDELALLRRNPLATALLERLVLVDAAGAVGLFRAEDCSLEGAHGERVLIGGAVTIAHPYALAQAGLLADWQAEIVRRQIVQPFKQVFRELYILTPAEREADAAAAQVTSNRIVDDNVVPAEGQVTRSQFLQRLHDAVIAAANEALGPMWSAAGCPYIEAWFSRNQGTSASALERMAQRYAGMAAPARTAAADMRTLPWMVRRGAWPRRTYCYVK